MGTHIRRGDTALIDQPDSPKWVFGDQVTMQRNFMATNYQVAKDAAPMKGAIGTGIAQGLIVRESQVTRVRGSAGSLQITYENFPGAIPGQGAQLPADEAEVVNEKLERALPKHERYASLTETLLNHINVLLETTDEGKRTTALTAVVGPPGNALANELYQKLKRGETHYLIYAPVYRKVLYSWIAPPDLEAGGFRESPPTFPIIPPAGYEWIREGDRLSWNGTHWVTERKWLGAPEWDAHIYP